MFAHWVSPRSLIPLIPLVFFSAGCVSETEKRDPDPPTVLVTRPVVEQSGQVQNYTGSVRPRYETDHAFRVGGKLASRKVELGQEVKAGQVLAVLDETDLLLSVQASEHDVKAAAAVAQSARLDEERLRRVRETGAVSGSEYDQRKSNRDSAEQQLKKAERMLELAKNRLEYATLKATSDGVVTGLSVEAGQVVAEGQPVARVAHKGQREAIVGIPEHRIGVARGAKAQVELWSSPGVRHTATLREVAPTADPATRTYQVRYSLPDDFPGEIGMTVVVTLAPQLDKIVYSVPLTAIAANSEGAGVWVVEPETNRLTWQKVTVGEYRSDRAVITSGLKGGERVVRAGVQKLDAGLAVRVREDDR